MEQSEIAQEVEGVLSRFKDGMADWFRTIQRSGGLQFDDPRPVVLARVEQPSRSDFPESELITLREMDDLVATYDPDVRVAPVTVGFSRDAAVAGPAHVVGQYLPPLGQIRGEDWHLDHDDLNLFGMVRQIIDEDGRGRVDRMVSEGFLQRSVEIRIGSKENGGKAQLWRFALVGGEQPGIPNMPPLDRIFGAEHMARSAREWKSLGLKPSVLNEVKCRAFAILDDMQQEIETMTPDDIKQLTDGIVAGLREVVSGQTAALNQSLDASSQATAVAITDGLKTLTERVAAVEEKATDDGKKVEEAKATAEAAAEKQRAADEKARKERRSGYESRITKLVRGGHVTPNRGNEIEAELFAEGVPDSVVEASLAALERAAATASGNLITSVRIGDSQPVKIDPKRFASNGRIPEIAAHDAETIARAEVATRGITDPIERTIAHINHIFEQDESGQLN